MRPHVLLPEGLRGAVSILGSQGGNSGEGSRLRIAIAASREEQLAAQTVARHKHGGRERRQTILAVAFDTAGIFRLSAFSILAFDRRISSSVSVKGRAMLNRQVLVEPMAGVIAR